MKMNNEHLHVDELDKKKKKKRRKKESEKEPNPFDEKPSNFQEIEKIMAYLGRKHSDGAVKGDNLTKVLDYLINTKQESYETTVSKLSLICGMMARYVKENYLNGIEAFGFIYVYMNGNTKCWQWVGIE